MKQTAPNEFGEYLRRLRLEKKLGIRELARKAHLDAGALTRLEQGNRKPRPETLKALASALNVPLADLFGTAGYITPSELPSISTYLRVRYGALSDTTLGQVEQYIRHLVDDRGLEPDGPAELEDETLNPSTE